MAILSCENTSFSYEGRVVVDQLNFHVNQGDYLCIVGENGAGKSTLIKGLLKLKTPSQGKITLGEDLKATELGYLPQQTRAQRDFPAGVFEVVLSGRLNSMGLRPFYTKKDKEMASAHMRDLGIEHLRKKSYANLSGGQQQRVLLARALCSTKKLLLLDEPTTGLDPIMTQDFYKIVKHLNHNHGITIIMVSHDVKGAVENSKTILHLNNRQLFFGPTEEYKNTPLGMEFLGGDSK